MFTKRKLKSASAETCHDLERGTRREETGHPGEVLEEFKLPSKWWSQKK